MSSSKKLSKLNSKIDSLTSTLSSLHPAQSLFSFRYTLGSVHLSLQETSLLQDLQGRVYSISWGGYGSSKNPGASNMLLSASDEGELTIWNIQKSQKIHKVNIYSQDPWLMCCAFEHSEGSIIAAGGMEGKLHLYKLTRKTGLLTISEHPVISIQAHDNYLSKCEFLTSTEILSASGDTSIKLWPIEARPEPVRIFQAHSQDVLGLATTLLNPALFLTGGCDSYCKVWDVRAKDPIAWNYWWRSGHVNSVKFMKDNEFTFAAGNSAEGVKVFDLRMVQEISHFSQGVEVTDVEFCKSGRVLFVADESGKVKIWDVFDNRLPIQVISGDVEQISAVSLSPLGDVLCFAGLARGISVYRSQSRTE